MHAFIDELSCDVNACRILCPVNLHKCIHTLSDAYSCTEIPARTSMGVTAVHGCYHHKRGQSISVIQLCYN